MLYVCIYIYICNLTDQANRETAQSRPYRMHSNTYVLTASNLPLPCYRTFNLQMLMSYIYMYVHVICANMFRQRRFNRHRTS